MFGKKKRRPKKNAEGSGAAGPGSGDFPDEAAAPPGPGQPGSSIGRYAIESTLGQGGMGKVYMARDPVIGRTVALKVISIRPDLTDEEAGQYRERFLREAQAAGALIHPNIVAVHDIGKDPATGSPYIVMEHVPGQDLKKVILSRAPLPAADAVAVVMQIAAALDYAHRRGIVHRDIKPANVLLTDQGRVKITDFGVARLPGSDLTRSDQFVGSPGFMSPEQLKGGQVDGRSDLFALGVILYQLLTGKAPFEGSSVSEVLYRISTQPADPPSETHTDVSPDFDPILEKALAKDPVLRFQSGQEFIAALAELSEKDEPAAAARDASADDPAAGPVAASPWFTLRSPWRIAALVACLALAFVGVNWGIVTLFHGPLRHSVRRVERESAGAQPREAIRFAGTTLPMPAQGGRAGGIPRADAAAEPDYPVTAVCAQSYASPTEMARLLETARRSRGRSPAVSFAGFDRPNGRIRVEVRHRMKSGRLVVLVDGRTVLSKPFGTSKGRSGTVTHVLSVPAGRHGVEVRLLEEKGTLLAKSRVSGEVSRNGMAVLVAEQRSSGKKGLELDWRE